MWDIAAASLIVSESGGIFTDLDGKELEIKYADPKKQYLFVAGHPEVVKEVAAHLS